MEPTPIVASVDYEKPGKQLGQLAVPYSHNLGGWANLQVPVAVLAAGEGPTVLLMAGNHGDEYRGRVAILKLCRELALEDVRGRLIMIPALNVPGSKAATRLSPLDGKNFNRSFPGDPTGSVSEMLAHYLINHLFPMADVVIDLHTGGRSFDFYPCAHMHLVPDHDQRRKMVAAAEAYDTDLAFLYIDVAGTGLLPGEAERQGKVVVTTEMGGGESVPAKVHRLSQEGLRNVLVHLGVLAGEQRSRSDLGLRPTAYGRRDGCSHSTARTTGSRPSPESTRAWSTWAPVLWPGRWQDRSTFSSARTGSRLPSSRRPPVSSSAPAGRPSSARAIASPASPTTSIGAFSSNLTHSHERI